MEDSSRPKRSKPRIESGMHGKHYERKIFALTALKCLLDKDIQDFWLLSNPEVINKFDDVILLTEYKNGKKYLFMIQIKHRLQGTDHPIIADKLDGKDKNLSLEMYEKAFLEIKGNDEFLRINDIGNETDIIFILFNNCKVTKEIDNCNIAFDNSGKCFEFIDTSKNTGVLKINNKSNKYNQNFIDQFYFYTEQLNEDSVNNEIRNLLRINDDTVQALINFFNSWVEPTHDCTKLTKLDLKIKLLDILLGDFLPPRNLKSVANSKLIDLIKNFDATVITEENSSTAVWNEILHEIQHFCEDQTLRLSNWDECRPKIIPEMCSHLLNKENLLINKNIMTIKLMYMFFVTQRKIPFFITVNNRLFNSFKYKLLHALDIYSVVFNGHKEYISFEHTTNVFQNLNNIGDKLYFRHPEKLIVSFQGKADTDLYNLAKNYDEIKLMFSVDDYIELLQKKITVGEANMLPTYHVNRKMRVPVFNSEVFDNNELIFFIFEFPRTAKIKNHRNIDLLNYILLCSDEIYGKSLFIVTTHEKFTNTYINLLEPLSKNRKYVAFKYISNNSFLLIHTNVFLGILRPYLKYTCKRDVDLYNINKNCNVNIICNNAGMGKSMFLNFINSKLLPDEWVIHIDLKKHSDHIKKIKTVKELIRFSFKCQSIKVSESFYVFLMLLYEKLNHKIIWLIDDYEEVNQPTLLELLKLAAERGFRIWIVARPLLKSEFENIFGVFSMKLEEFSKEDQEIFTQKYLQEKDKSKHDIDKIMSAINNVRHLLEDSFIGTCQQTMMLNEIFLNYDSSWKEEEWRIHDIYEKFINLKVSDSYGVYKEWYIRTVSKLALKVFFMDDALKDVFDIEEFEEDVKIFKNNYPKDFFISEFVQNNVPIFSHRTYAEFLAARWLLHTVKKQMRGNTHFDTSNIFRMLYIKELTAVRLFFDNMTTKHLPLHCAIVNKEKGKIEALTNCVQHFSETDLLGRSVFHLLSSYANYFDIGITTETTHLVRNLDIHSQVVRNGQHILLKPDVESTYFKNSEIKIFQHLNKLPFLDRIIAALKEDALLKLNSIDYALLSGSLQELDVLLNLKKLIVMKDNRELKLPSEEMKYHLLFHCIRNKYKNILFTLDVENLHNVKIDPSKGSLLHLAVTSENVEAVKRLTQHNSLEFWGVDIEGNTPLHIACDQKRNSMLKCLFVLEDKISVDFLNRQNSKGESHLHFLARRRHTKWIKTITKISGINIDPKDCNGNTPFLLSILFNKAQNATILYACGAKVNCTNNKQMTALHYAASKGFLKCVEKLLTWKAGINQKDNFGMTPLMKASAWNHKNVVALLLVNNAKINLLDKNRWTALHHAVRRNNTEIIDLLIKYKAGVNFVNKNRETPLIIACKYNFPAAVELLLNCEITYGKKIALEISVKKNHKECIDLLFRAGITP